MAEYFIQDVNLFDGFRAHAEKCSVWLAGGKIKQVFSAKNHYVPADAEVIDGRGNTLMPGLIDAHTHVFRGVEEAKRAIFAGVTTVFDLNNKPEDALYMKALSRRSSELPEIYSALYSATINGSWPRAIVQHTARDPAVLSSLKDYPKLSTPESARAFVAKQKAQGADVIKLIQESGECLTLSNLPAPTSELQKAIITAAHDHDLLTLAHATNLRETSLVLDAGVDGLAHQFFDRPHDQALIDKYHRHKAFLVPTLTAISSMMGLPTAKHWANRFATGEFLPEASRNCLCDCMKIAREGCSVEYAYDCIRALKDSGVDIICGTDSGPSIHGTAMGAAVHLEMSLYVEKCGFTPEEALRSATGLSAKRLRLSDRGVVAVGKRADLVLVHGNPTVDIADSTQIVKVWKEGQLCRLRG